jgi:hypothetical protein
VPDRTRVSAKILLAVTAAWAAAGLVFPGLPGWTMFAKAEPASARLIDATGEAVEVYDLLPRDVYLIDRAGTRAIAAWQCRTRPERAPWRLRWPDGAEEDACAK